MSTEHFATTRKRKLRHKSSESNKRSRDLCIDRSVPLAGKEKVNRMDLGLEILLATFPGVPFSAESIAYFCGCTPTSISNIEKKALDKLRARQRFIDQLHTLGLHDTANALMPEEPILPTPASA